MNTQMIHKKDYDSENLKEIWSHRSYAKYEHALWDWWHLPFVNNHCARKIHFERLKKPVRGNSILELGSAMGQAYAFMKSSDIVDVCDYSGIEVSRMGYETSCKRFPETNWIHADFTTFSLHRTYDYTFERHAVHHMRNPLEQYRKVIGHTKIAFQTLFRGFITGKTISNLELGHFVSDSGFIYLNVINLFDVIQIGLEAGFKHVGVLYCGVHEPISSDPNEKIFLHTDVQRKNGKLHRFAIKMIRCATSHPPTLTCSSKSIKDFFSPSLFELREKLSEFERRKL